ncbi:MAG: hypothetical protein PWQ14_1262, partial [Rikenellaceae bacterium]|nr:hypothetical protein [Rikenellaceae bacterium]
IIYMIIDNLIIDNELFTSYFACDLNKCHGICCVEGEAGAPIEKEEVTWLEENIEKYYNFLDAGGKKSIDATGVYELDIQSDIVTPLKDTGECAYAIVENNCTICIFEKLFKEGLIEFYKPISCHLYPIRVYKLIGFYHLTLNRWHTCSAAFDLGKKQRIPVLFFVKDALKRRFPNQVDKILDNVKEI